MTVEKIIKEEKNERKKQQIATSLLEFHLQSAAYQNTLQERGAPTEERKKIMELIFQVLQKELFIWEKFTIELPKSKIEEEGLFVSTSQLFQDNRHLDELRDVALGPDGRQKRVPEECLKQIKERGRFEVESNQFIGKKHVWELSRLVMRGYLNLRDDLFRSLSFSYSQLFISPINRITSRVSPSIREGVKYIGKMAEDVVKGTVGVREMETKNYQINLSIARLEYILGDFYDNFEKSIDRYHRQENEIGLDHDVYDYNYDENSRKNCILRQLWNEIGILHRGKNSKEGNILIGNDEIERLDWRLFNPIIRQIASQIVHKEVEILNQSWKRTNREFVESLADELTSLGLAGGALAKFVFDRCEVHSLRLLFLRLLSSFDRSFLGRGMGEKVVKYFIVKKEVAKIDEKWSEIRTKFEEEIKKEMEEKHPIKFHTREFFDDFMQRRLKEKFQIDESADLDRFILDQKFNQLIDFLEKNNEFDFDFGEEIYLLERERRWEISEKFQAMEKFRHVLQPVRVYCWQQTIWRPQHWLINKNGSTYEVKTSTDHSVSSSTNFWRIKNIIVRSRVWFFNNIYRFYQNAINGKYGLKALYKLDKFYPRSHFDYSIGQIVPSLHYEVKPMVYRIKEVFKSIRESRSRFEATPDNGFLGKDISRVFNLFWNYFLVLPFGMAYAGGIYPAGCVVSIATSLLLLLTAIVTSPIAAIIKYLFTVLIYDEESCKRSSPLYFPLINSIAWNGGVKGIAQIAAAIVAIAAHPLIAFFVSIFSIFRFGTLRSIDWLIYHLVIKRKAKIPISNTFVAKRIAGPGLNREYFYQLSPDSAMIALMIHLERLELDLFEEETIYQLNEPNRHYHHLINQLIGSFVSPHSFSLISSNIEKYRSDLCRQLKKRRKRLPNQIGSLSSGFIRQRPDDFNETIERAHSFVLHFIPHKIFSRIYLNNDAKINSFWQSTPIDRGEWGELTKYYLSSIFGPMFLQPLSDDDTTLELQIDKASKVSNFLKMIKSNEIHDDLDLHRVRLINQSNQITKEFELQLDSLDVSAGFSRLDVDFTANDFQFYLSHR